MVDMQRLVAPLAVLGFVLLGVAAWLYSRAADDKSAADAMCRLGGGACGTMSWTPMFFAVVAAVLVLFAAWRLGRQS